MFPVVGQRIGCAGDDTSRQHDRANFAVIPEARRPIVGDGDECATIRRELREFRKIGVPMENKRSAWGSQVPDLYLARDHGDQPPSIRRKCEWANYATQRIHSSVNIRYVQI